MRAHLNAGCLAVLERLRECACCPRQCHADRYSGPLGVCRTDAGFHIGSICQHRGEEPVFGDQGLVNVFFTRCNLQCVFCQNYQISRRPAPQIEHTLTLDEVVARIETLLDRGVKGVGFVSPSHVLPQVEAIMSVLAARRPKPVFVMNTNAYDRVESLRELKGRMDVYLPDLKYQDGDLAEAYSQARDYPEVAGRALKEMFRQKGEDVILDADGDILSGLIIRHLVLPGRVENSRLVLRFIARELSPRVTLSLMAQYTPVPAVANDPLLSRAVSEQEYDEVKEEMERLGFERGWVQELDSSAHYQPDFALTHPFEQ